MASSAGREKIRSRGQRVFAFGSSTPRDLSHLKQTTPTQNNDTKSAEKPESPTLHDYIVKARSLSREGTSRSHLVFGSSTPRLLAHLDKIPASQRAYDAKIPKKSATHNDFKAAPIRFNSVAPLPKPPRKEEARHVITSKDDDIASEPDIVQDREEFLNELKKHKKRIDEDKKNAEKARNESMASPKMVTKKPITKTTEEVKFAHAPDIVGNTQRTVRINSETHEEAPIAVENLSGNKMNDQIEVSQLNDEIGAVETTGEKEKVVGNLLAKVQKVVNDTTDDVANEIEKNKEKLKNEVSEKVEHQVTKGTEEVKNIAKSVEVSAKKVAEEAQKKVDNGIKSVESSIEKTATEIKTAIGSVISSGEKTISDFGKNVNDVAKNVSEDVTNALTDGKEPLGSGISKIGEKAETALGDIKKGLENF